jgi:outer membrane protein assembly factor BamB
VSANGAAKASGIVWAMTPSQDNQDGALLVRGTLSAYDAENVSKRLWTSDDVTADAVGTLVKFCPPTIAAGRVFVATGDDALRVYGLRAQ